MEAQNSTALVDKGGGVVKPGAEECWRAVLTKDASFDGVVVYGVRSTGVYCRPSCGSRRPRRSQVVFFPIPEAAEQAGFRSCRRCHPHLETPADPSLEMVRQVCLQIRGSRDGPPTLAQLGANLGFDRFHLQRVFKRVMGITPRQYADAWHIDALKTNLKNGWKVTDALYEAGYGSTSRLYERAPAQMGMTPATYRRGGQGLKIAYTTVASPVGVLLVAATERGICAVKLGDDKAALESGLRAEYPASDIRREVGALKDWVGAILQHLSGNLPRLDLPLDIRATAFERMVWERLQAIPYGQTRTYRQIATEVGRPNAARAVGRACAANPVALVVPCHRVVRDNGELGGYHWGVERKAALLKKESSKAI